MHIIYRISDAGYKKTKPSFINNKQCLKNAMRAFSPQIHEWIIFADNCGEETMTMLKYWEGLMGFTLKEISVGHGAGTFNVALDYALTLDASETVYFLENDYIHVYPLEDYFDDMFNLGADYATLYNHPDKFIAPQNGGNPEVDVDGGYITKLYRGKLNVYYLVNSTTMTFASKVKTLKEDESILRRFTEGSYPRDYEMFLALRDKGRSLLCPIDSISTHGETQWLGVATHHIDLESYWETFS